MNLVFTLKRGEIAVELLIARSEHQAGIEILGDGITFKQGFSPAKFDSESIVSLV